MSKPNRNKKSSGSKSSIHANTPGGSSRGRNSSEDSFTSACSGAHKEFGEAPNIQATKSYISSTEGKGEIASNIDNLISEAITEGERRHSHRLQIIENVTSSHRQTQPKEVAQSNALVLNVCVSHQNTNLLGTTGCRPLEQEQEIEIRITPPPVPPVVVYGPPPIAGAPPSYSAIMKISSLIEPPEAPPYTPYPTRRDISIQPSPPFIAVNPPPSYAEAEGLFLNGILVPSTEQMVLGPEPALVICPRCQMLVVTSIHTHSSNMAHLAALTLCLCFCWPFCLLPYCLGSCKITYHTCPHCHDYLGVYRPW